jgi:ADP-heptose:LPS heptosyltransferase
VLNLTDEERRGRVALASSVGIDPAVPIVGINTGAGNRWPLKRWRPEGFVQLIEHILGTTCAEVMMLGGRSEEETNARMRARFDERVHHRTAASLREFIRLIDLCDIVVTGDTLALHAAVGLGKRVVALFGPTSAAEIDLYGLGTKIVPRIECLCCYQPVCTRTPNCMDMISAEDVFVAVTQQLSVLGVDVSAEGRDANISHQYAAVGEPGR